jgi:hypothetical protein
MEMEEKRRETPKKRQIRNFLLFIIMLEMMLCSRHVRTFSWLLEQLSRCTCIGAAFV